MYLYLLSSVVNVNIFVKLYSTPLLLSELLRKGPIGLSSVMSLDTFKELLDFFYGILSYTSNPFMGPVGGINYKLNVWSQLVVGDDWIVQGRWVGDRSLLLSLCSLLFSILHKGINCPGWGWVFHPLSLDPFHFLHSSHFSFLFASFLGIDARRLRSREI